jgi:ribosomal protein L21E
MSKYKAGDKVRVISVTSTVATTTKIAMIGKICEIRDMSGNLYQVYDLDKLDFWHFSESDLQPVKKTLRDMNVGDVVVGENGLDPSVVALVMPNAFIHVYEESNNAELTSLADAEKFGWKFQTTEPEPEPETITVNGKKYNAEAVRERLSELEEIE